MRNSHSEPRVRPAAPADLDAFLRLDEALVATDRAYDPTLDPAWTRSPEGRGFFADRLGGDGLALVAESQGEILGTLTGALCASSGGRLPLRIAEVETLFVDKAARGRGLGKRLLDAFAAWAAQQGAERIAVRVSAANREALRFYGREGFDPYDIILERPTHAPAHPPADRETGA